MKKSLILVLLSIAGLLAASPKERPKAAAFASLDWNTDKRPWKAAHESGIGDEMLVEYVLEDPPESVWNWTELVTIDVSEPVTRSLNDLPETIFEMKRAAQPTAKHHLKVLHRGEHDVVFEWWVDPPRKDSEHGWVKVMSRPERTVSVHYATKSLEQFEAMRPVWGKIVAEAEACEDCKTAHAETAAKLEEKGPA